MNTHPQIQDQIDLLVDGELPDDKRAVLLTRFDTQPDSWRQCALTFLENQMLQNNIRPVAARRPSIVLRAAAVAAALVFAFTLGGFIAKREANPGDLASAPQSPAPQSSSPSPFFQRSDELFHVSHLGGQPLYSTREDLPPIILDAVVRAGHGVQQIERTITLPAAGGETIELPIRETRILDMRPTAL